MKKIQPDDCRNGHIPVFFIDQWRSDIFRAGLSDYAFANPLVEYKKEERQNTLRDWLFLLCILAAVVFFFLILWGYYSGNWTITGIGILGTCLSLVLGSRLYAHLLSSTGKSHELFKDLDSLFSEFDIDPGEETGKLSNEEFRGYVEDALKKKGIEVDMATGFDKHRLRIKFNRMHVNALRWHLCHESHSMYFPVKPKAWQPQHTNQEQAV